MPGQTPSDHSPARILIVDDNPTNRYVLRTTLSRAGHTVVEAEDGTGALALLKDADALPEVAVVDVRLPDMTGFEVCERIKADPATAALPVLHVSASAITVDDRTQGLNRGADAYLTEPIAPDELLATVTATLRYARARRRAERLADRLLHLNEATLLLYSADSAAGVARAAARGAAIVLGAPAVAAIISPHGEPASAAGTATSGEAAPDTVADVRLDARDLRPYHEFGDRTGTRLLTVHAREWPGLPHGIAPHGRLTVAVARAKPGRQPVCLAVPAEAVSTPDDEQLLAQLAQACALALEALRSYTEEHDLALTLQRSFLPETLPDSHLADLAVRYLPASDHAEIGGDFYEALPTRGGLLLAVGDVAGHSLDAAMLMGQIRHALRAYAIEGHPPHDILGRLDHLLAAVGARLTLTLCIVFIDEATGLLHIANAGHLPPLLRTPDGRVRSVDEHGPLLGIGLPHPVGTAVEAPPGSVLVMTTDGLIERRHEHLGLSLERLESALEGLPADVEGICDGLLEAFPPNGEDDIALMAVRLTGCG
ncbi:fused response regulator/phosphatase [Streptomyces sp. NRRL F-6491]|uniref:fused response regulator/phosphatase n=1 Tax=Streptomyces sp. NRRL F-6491 TaxID=1519495 RepID=UPI0006AEDB31|nr:MULTISPECIES: fused response regulator/phosphatase [unclassified Streptomyces]